MKNKMYTAAGIFAIAMAVVAVITFTITAL